MATLLMLEIERLEKSLLAISSLVEERLFAAARAVELRDRQLAQQIIDGDDEIDRAEVELEEACLKILALHQPVASDLRFVIMVLKINNDLERVGDMAVTIAKRVRHLSKYPTPPLSLDLKMITTTAWQQLKKSLDAFVDANADQAREIIAADETIDQLYKSGRKSLIAAIRQQPEQVKPLLDFLRVLRSCERIGDLAANIAEDVVYFIDGEIARHQKAKIEAE